MIHKFISFCLPFLLYLRHNKSKENGKINLCQFLYYSNIPNIPTRNDIS